MVAQDVSHCFRGHTEEVRAALHRELLLVRDFEIDLVDQRRGVEGEVAVPSPSLAAREDTELIVDEPEQRVDRVAVTVLDRPQQIGNRGRCRRLGHFVAPCARFWCDVIGETLRNSSTRHHAVAPRHYNRTHARSSAEPKILSR